MRITYITASILTTNVLLLSISLYWTVTSWSNIHTIKTAPAFLPRNCTILSRQIVREQNTYDNQFTVTLHTLSEDPKPKVPTFAYRYGRSVFNQTRRQAEAFEKGKLIGATYQCFIAPPRNATVWEYVIALQRPGNQPSLDDRDMALISTTFTCIAILAIVLQLVCVSATQATELTFIQPAPPPQPVTTGLDRELIDRICEEHVELEEFDCAICLDGSEGKATKLPCGHLFHIVCVRGWLLRGGRCCPLCNWDLGKKREAKENGQRIRRISRGIGEVSNLVRNASWRLLVEQNSGCAECLEGNDDGKESEESEMCRAGPIGGNSGDSGSGSGSPRIAGEENQLLLERDKNGSGEVLGLRLRKSGSRSVEGECSKDG